MSKAAPIAEQPRSATATPPRPAARTARPLNPSRDTSYLSEPAEELGIDEGQWMPAPKGAVCKHCLSTDLALSRNSGLYALARVFGYKVYRCRRCLSRTLW